MNRLVFSIRARDNWLLGKEAAAVLNSKRTFVFNVLATGFIIISFVIVLVFLTTWAYVFVNLIADMAAHLIMFIVKLIIFMPVLIVTNGNVYLNLTMTT